MDPNRANQVLEQVHCIPKLPEDPTLREELFYQSRDIRLFRKRVELVQKYKRCYCGNPLLGPKTTSSTSQVGTTSHHTSEQNQATSSTIATATETILILLV